MQSTSGTGISVHQQCHWLDSLTNSVNATYAKANTLQVMETFFEALTRPSVFVGACRWIVTASLACYPLLPARWPSIEQEVGAMQTRSLCDRRHTIMPHLHETVPVRNCQRA